MSHSYLEETVWEETKQIALDVQLGSFAFLAVYLNSKGNKNQISKGHYALSTGWGGAKNMYIHDLFSSFAIGIYRKLQF